MSSDRKSLERKKQAECELKLSQEQRKKKENKEKIWKHIKKSFGNDKEFKLTKNEYDGEVIAKLERYIHFGIGQPKELQYVGSFCVQREYYMFRGADDCPEQECVDTYLNFKIIINNSAAIAAVKISDDYDVSKKELDDFCEQMAHYISAII